MSWDSETSFRLILSFHMVKCQQIGKLIFLEIIFLILAKFGGSGDLPIYFFQFFLRLENFLRPSIFFLRKRGAKQIDNERGAKIFYDPPLALQGLMLCKCLHICFITVVPFRYDVYF